MIHIIPEIPSLSSRHLSRWVAPPWGIPKAPPLTTNTAPRQKMAQIKEEIKAPEKIQLSDEEIANFSDAQFKTLVIRMLTEMVEHGHKIEETVKALKSEIKENVKGTNSKVKETRIQINSLDQKEEINIQLEWNGETRK